MSPKGKIGAVIGLCFVVLAFALIMGLLSRSGKKEQAQKAQVVAVDAYIHFDGTRFAITNNNDYDWTNVRFEVNSGPGLPSGGYVLKHPPMQAGNIYSVEALQFCKADGTKLNPQTTKPQNFSIFCDTPAGPATGSWYGELK